ncbi:DinB family protein [Mangrovimonas spongiae]|uniref:DinB family protein n=1 Tax=Mangrovimonas spongiae TaxID=2494697 RepID=A0A428K6M0_9FLAO|nr:DinB family protein [Mangrovimonas spongiae]RSK42063.1 DinB family protein [Mangrovimonas spongiae]
MKNHFLALIFLFSVFTASSQYKVEPPKGFSQNIGNMVSMLDNLKDRVERLVKDLNEEQTDFLIDENANRIGAIIYHLAATEAYYQIYTFEGRQFNEEEKVMWETALSLGEKARQDIQGKPIKYYLNIYDDVRKKTKKLLKQKDDTWFSEKNGVMTNHWAWFHVMEHQANHMGQLAFLTKRLPN